MHLRLFLMLANKLERQIDGNEALARLGNRLQSNCLVLLFVSMLAWIPQHMSGFVHAVNSVLGLPLTLLLSLCCVFVVHSIALVLNRPCSVDNHGNYHQAPLPHQIRYH